VLEDQPQTGERGSLLLREASFALPSDAVLARALRRSANTRPRVG
jgi:hypothetical protein